MKPKLLTEATVRSRLDRNRIGRMAVYCKYLNEDHALKDEAEAIHARVELKGKDLACTCPLDQPCHGDVLIEALVLDGVGRGKE